MSAAKRIPIGPDVCAPPDVILEWLSAIFSPEQQIEVRSIRNGGRVSSKQFATDQMPEMIEHALDESAHCKGVYLTLNPVTVGTVGSTKDDQIERRHLLLIDTDPERESGISATDAEKALAFRTSANVRNYLKSLGWPDPIEADSGNGCHLLYAIDLPNDDPSRDLVKAVLVALARQFNTPDAKVDTSVYNASRITKFYGTIAKKGEATSDRPHRASRMLSIPRGFNAQVVSRELLEAVADVPPIAGKLPLDEHSAKESPFAGNAIRMKARDEWTPETRAIKYLQECDPAVSGKKGHNQAFKVACKMVEFGLGRDDCYRVLWQHYNPKCDPRWSEKELWHKVDEAFKKNGDRAGAKLKEGRNGFGGDSTRSEKRSAEGMPRRFNMTDLGNAERLVARHGNDLRYCHPWKKWLVWDGRRWSLDNTGAPRRRAKNTVRSIYGEASKAESDEARKALAKWGMESEKRDRISAMLTLAEAEEGIPILPGQMDQDPWAFNCLNGTIDLRTGKLRPHRREDLITKLCPVLYDHYAMADLWESTLQLFFANDQSLIDYFQAICGYAMTGVIRDHIMPVAYGKGANGKSTMLGTIIDVLGSDYAMKCPPDMLMAKKTDSHPTDRADLFGKRLVVAIETDAGRRLNETMVKELTGSDKIRARRMREDFWEFDPTHTLFMATNHKPAIRGTDDGIWRRLKLIPFKVRVLGKEADKEMPEKLRSEFPGILAWCVQGCVRWQSEGLVEPETVAVASSDYRKEQDVIGAFIEECCFVSVGVRVKASNIYARYKSWCEAAGINPLSLPLFGEEMTNRDIEKKVSNGVWYIGIALKPSDPDQSDEANEPPF